MHQRTALVSTDGVIHDIIVAGPGYDPPPGLRAVPTNTANVGDKHDGEKFVKAAPAQPQDTLVHYAMQRRDVIIRLGFNFDVAAAGEPPRIVRISATLERRADLADYAYAATHDPAAYSVPWVDNFGSAVLSAIKVAALRGRMSDHVAKAHDQLANALALIEAGAAITFSDIDSVMPQHD